MKKRMILFFGVFTVLLGSLFAQVDANSLNPIEIDGTDKTIDQVVNEMLIDWKEYNGRFVFIKNVTFQRFGIEPTAYAYTPDNPQILKNWISDPETFIIEESPLSERRRSTRFMFWFRPSDRDSMLFVSNLLEKYRRGATAVSMFGHFQRIQSQYGSITYHPFIVTNLLIDGKQYRGGIPNFLMPR